MSPYLYRRLIREKLARLRERAGARDAFVHPFVYAGRGACEDA